MKLNPRQLEAFRAVMLTGSMTIAAEALQVSQPAISRLIRDLEMVLSLRLFRREGNRLIPGAEAQVLYAEVDKFYQGIERIERVAEDLVTLRTGTLRISSMSTLGLSVVAEGVCRFARKHPEVRTSLDVRNSVGILELTSANQIDIGFVQIPSGEYPGIQVINLPPISAVCVMPANDMLATKDVVTLEDLHGRRLITLNANNPLQRRITSAMEARGVAGVSSVETTAAHSACGMVSGGLGITVCDPFTASYSKYPGLTFRPLDQDIPFEVSMVFPGHQQRSKLASDFMQVMEGIFRSEFISMIPREAY
ncbi:MULTISPECIES: LysR substrate-binding domain-containing protein [Pseudomonas]|jgi:DNA-binding transcriptional LysR family regulator|uniref:LysR substrate-binding domain-containing protein n=1 Tax=Pseudomonas TaxID=286 RepID=UPI000272C501|nr:MULTISPECIES: LysR substrate-binding domain-containing protein [Pseudomonas]EJF72177.1 LysR family transcriptional regulator [Pseudomonas sp. Ag1]NVZ37920.1 LysR family transcriptional regulator [Pseudomonas sp. 21615526]PMU23919.1 LysR family transcriptional regulator [Pseudomonas sp. GP01-A9]PMU27269.1 LysR family transcriptional regulator [Pseudomonas sp. GP01-A13]PMU36507.1 LysR family transcriptional regulator [Pseudomonas sp. GP01-A8]